MMCAAMVLVAGCEKPSEARAAALLDQIHPLIEPHGVALAQSRDPAVVETGAPLLAVACEWKGCGPE